MIVLRPHHLLCTQGYSGHGYDDAFVEHMNDVVHQLREVPGTRIHLTFSTDTLCSCCPNKLGEDLCDTQEKVKRYDRKTVEYFGLEEKDYVYQDLIRAMDAKATPEMLADICRDCCWFPVSACCKKHLQRQICKITSVFPAKGPVPALVRALLPFSARKKRLLHGKFPVEQPLFRFTYRIFCSLHRSVIRRIELDIYPCGDAGGPGVFLAQPAELLTDMVRALAVLKGDGTVFYL